MFGCVGNNDDPYGSESVEATDSETGGGSDSDYETDPESDSVEDEISESVEETAFETGGGSDSDYETESESDSVVESNRLMIVENGASEYVVVYPVAATSTVISAVDILVKQIETQTGVTLKSKTDNLRGAAAHDPNEKAILIGQTNYDESQEVLNTLNRFEYKIAQVGNKMVIAALDEAYVMSAIRYYVANLIAPNVSGKNGAKNLLLEEYHYIPENSNQDRLVINGIDITEFSIIYPDGDVEYKPIAQKLQSAVLSCMGIELPIYTDAEAEQKYEILLGKTNRSFSQRLYNSLEKYVATYSLEVEDTKLQILSGGYASASQCITDMRFSVLNDGVIEYKNGSYLKKSLFNASGALATDADIRIMTANILYPAWAGDRPNVSHRAELFAGILANYQPDAIGLQEAGGKWQTELEKWLEVLKEEYGIEYTWHHKTYEGQEVFSSILYRSDLYNCVEEDFYMFGHNNGNANMRVISSCMLQLKTDPDKQFILSNTHWDFDDNKTQCAEESITYINEEKNEEYPIFFTGDFNASRGEEHLESFIEGTGMQTADTDGIDFTFYFGDGVEAQKNTVLRNHYTTTDHEIRFTDFDMQW